MGIYVFSNEGLCLISKGKKRTKKIKDTCIDNFYEFSPEQSSQFDPNFVGASFG